VLESLHVDRFTYKMASYFGRYLHPGPTKSRPGGVRTGRSGLHSIQDRPDTISSRMSQYRYCWMFAGVKSPNTTSPLARYKLDCHKSILEHLFSCAQVFSSSQHIPCTTGTLTGQWLHRPHRTLVLRVWH